ncbi:Acetylene hydratase [Variovorax sp. SRS16]|uniref:molybdopterin-containing oxidoreductase family protein n=1 Tax=Variovorax sp. SRS16 TaxID=282217 RepID=UPI001317AAE6|nr:molybdopterin-dependent oxidoreductase [Variovorax sp. SRS16]VTU22504.1 Acetylene hydratase [Variovorax sp. SRS16]
MATHTAPSMCRNCLAYCPILVTVEDGRAIKVTGDPEAPAFDGYTCPKGRALPAQHNDPQRLLQCLKRGDGDAFDVVDSAAAMDQVAATVRRILAAHGPRSIAMYSGTGPVSHPAGAPIARAFFRAIQSRMTFSAASIDKPAEYTSVAMHGNWHAGLQTFETSDTWMIVGANPVIAKSNGAPLNNPGVRLKQATERGMKMIVIDPRRTETAKRAHVHLQPRPGQDPVLLAGIIHILIDEGLYDAGFVRANAEGFEALKASVAGCTPAFVAQRADVPQDRLLEAARTFGRGRRGGVVCSTGPSFSTHSNLSYYLALCLNTLCGRWAREGEPAPFPNVLLPAFTPRAQPYAPYPVASDRPMRVHGLMENASGVPTAALADEILLDGEGQVKVLFCLGGNPVLSWPDQAKTEAALRKLELLVVFDYKMTATAQFAHYVIPPPLSLEVPGTSQKVESLKYSGVSRGYAIPWAQYTPAVVPVPPGSDLIDDGAFIFGLAQRMGLQLDWVNARGQGPNTEGPARTMPLDMSRTPDNDELIALACTDSRIALEEVKAHPHGHVYDIDVRVQPREPGHTAMLQLGNPMMMDELAALQADGAEPAADPALPFQLVCRRANNTMNSVGQTLPALGGGKVHAPACMHSRDLAALGLKDGDLVTVRSRCGHMLARIEADDNLRQGVVSVVHGFGAPISIGTADPERSLGSVTRLLDMDERDPISGIPRMSAVPVSVQAAAHAA